MSQDDFLHDFKYVRFGHIDQDRHNDTLVMAARSLLPGEKLPPYWQYRHRDFFVEKYGDLGTIVWAVTQNYHMLLIHGHRVFRMWTADGTSQHVLVDVLDHIGNQVAKLEDIPKGSLTKCKPFTKRVKLTTLEEVEKLINTVKVIYGLEDV